jgi:hypothetical protein
MLLYLAGYLAGTNHDFFGPVDELDIGDGRPTGIFRKWLIGCLEEPHPRQAGYLAGTNQEFFGPVDELG